MPNPPPLYRVHHHDGSVIDCQKGHEALVLALLPFAMFALATAIEVGARYVLPGYTHVAPVATRTFLPSPPRMP